MTTKPTITQGRFYYEAPNLGRYEIRKNAKGATNDWSSVSEAIIWTGKETLWIEGDTRRCRKFSTAELQLLLSQPEYKKSYWFSGLFRGLLGAEEMLPLTIGIHATEVRERFEVTLKEKRGDERIELKVVPKPQMVNARFREIDVILDAKTYMTIATQEVSGNGTLRTVLELSEQKVNQSQRPQPVALPGLVRASRRQDRAAAFSLGEASWDRNRIKNEHEALG